MPSIKGFYYRLIAGTHGDDHTVLGAKNMLLCAYRCPFNKLARSIVLEPVPVANSETGSLVKVHCYSADDQSFTEKGFQHLAGGILLSKRIFHSSKDVFCQKTGLSML